MMKLIIFGATGGTGLQLVEQALEKEHMVTAFVRNPTALGIKHKNLRVLQGDVMNLTEVEAALDGHEVVLSALGAPAANVGKVRSVGTHHILQAMEKVGVNRFICQTSLGYGDSRSVLDRTPLYFKYLIVPFILKKAFADHALQEAHILQSRLDWTIVRPGNLTDGEYTGIYRHGFSAQDKEIKVKVSRADVADFMLRQLDSNMYIRKVTGISY